MARRSSLPVIGLLLAGAALGACRDEGGKGEYFAISGKLFEFNYRLAKATYIVTLNPMQPMDDSQVAVASFENPAGGEPLVIRQKIWPKLDHVTLESPPLTCVVKDKPYAVSISIEGADGAVVQKIDTTMTSSLDQSILPDRPLVVGPVYELNQDLAGHPDGACPTSRSPTARPRPAELPASAKSACHRKRLVRRRKIRAQTARLAPFSFAGRDRGERRLRFVRSS